MSKTENIRLIIAGSRNITDQNLVNYIMEKCSYVNNNLEYIVCGMAKGVDTLAYNWAKEHNVKIIEMPANWEKYGKQECLKFQIY